ncbi:DUF5990 family protein [Micromonospora sp. NPDC051296]|uniref:DUF5990 family protein n=1 Tax=Micromonospora sp. NPDC051296 TaxID=3155046 RepID=UPI003435940F
MSDVQVTLTIVADGLPPTADAFEVGLQAGKDRLLAGTPTDDGGLRYECVVAATSRPDGSTGFRGECVHGPTAERFLYLSARAPGGDSWYRRLKIMLPRRPDLGTGRLAIRVRDEGRARAGVVTDWTPA